MARFITPQQQDVVSMYTPPDINFYTQLMDKAQQNVDSSMALRAAAIEKYGDLDMYSKEDSDLTVGKAREALKDATNMDFPNAARVANMVMRAQQEVSPYVNALKAKGKAAELYDKIRITHGANAWMGTDPRTQSIADAGTGAAVDPSMFKATGVNSEDIAKAFLASQQSTLTRPGQLTSTRKGAPEGMRLENQTFGPSKEEFEQIYGVGTESARAFAQSQLQTTPELKEIFGNDEAAINRLMEFNYQTAGNHKMQDVSRFANDPAYLNALQRKQLKGLDVETVTKPSILQPITGSVEQRPNTAKEMLKLLIPKTKGISNSEIEFDSEGNRIKKEYSNVPEVYHQTAQQSRGLTGGAGFRPIVANTPKISAAERIEGERRAKEQNDAQEQVISTIRKVISNSGKGVLKTEDGRYRGMTDKEAFDFFNEAIENSANIFTKDYEVTPGIDIPASNPFFDSRGGTKNFADANVEIYNEKDGWTSVDKDALAEELGYKYDKKGENADFEKALKGLSSEVYTFGSGSTKQVGSINTKKGNISVRYDANPKMQEAKEPVVQLMNAFHDPSYMTSSEGKEINLGGGVKVMVKAEIVTDEQGNPSVYPKLTAISAADEYDKQKLLQLYYTQGYQGIIDQYQAITDKRLYDNQGVVDYKTAGSYQVPTYKP